MFVAFLFGALRADLCIASLGPAQTMCLSRASTHPERSAKAKQGLIAGSICTPAFGGCVLSLLALVIPLTVISSLPNGDLWGDDKFWSEYCEPKRKHSALVEPVNAWSSLAYSLNGVYLFAATIHDLQQQQWGTSSSASPYGMLSHHPISSLRANPAFGFVIALIEMVHGVSSFLFHASNTSTWQRWDAGFMNNAAAAMVSWSACSLCLEHLPAAQRHPRATTFGFLFSLLSVVVIFVHFKWQISSTLALTSLIGVGIFLECVLQPLLAQRSLLQRVLTGCAIVLFAEGYVVRELEVNKHWDRPLCLWWTWFQAHALWHILTAAACSCQFVCWRATPPPPPRARHCGSRAYVVPAGCCSTLPESTTLEGIEMRS